MTALGRTERAQEKCPLVYVGTFLFAIITNVASGLTIKGADWIVCSLIVAESRTVKFGGVFSFFHARFKYLRYIPTRKNLQYSMNTL